MMRRNKLLPLDRLLLRVVRLRLFLPLLVVTLLATGLVGYLGERNLEIRQQQLAWSLARTVDRYLEHARRMLATLIRVADTSTPEALARYMKGLREAYGYFDTLYYLDESGRITLLAPLDPRYQGLDMSNQPYFQEAKGKAGAVISQPFLSPRTGQPTVCMAWALADGSEVIGELNLATLQEAIEAGRSRAGKDSVFILDRSGTVLAHPSSRLVQQQANLGHQEIVRHGLEDETTLAHAADGSLALCSTAQVARTGWLVVAQMPWSTALGPYALTMGLVLSASLTFWFALAWIIRKQLGRHVVAPLAQLRQGTAALTAGDFSQGGILAEIPAAFAEIRELAADFQHMSQALQARQAALQRSEERYRSLFDGVPVGVYRTTPAGQFLDTNPALVDMLGYPNQESLRALNAADLYADPDDRKHWQAVIEREGIVRDFEARLRRFDGTIIWVNNAGRVVRADKGEVLYCEASMADITERKRAEEEKLEMERRLLHAQKLESLGVLAGGIAHDFNNLLHAVLGNLDLALLPLPPSSPAYTHIQAAMSASRRAADLTRQMLAYSGKGRFVVNELNLSELVQENVHLLEAAISRTVTLDLRLGKDLPPIVVDAGQIQQVIMNLITNASEAMAEKAGVVAISTGMQDCDEGDLYQSRMKGEPAAGRFVYLEVSDTGCGMNEETQARLFDPFFTTKFSGRGLGMSAVLGIVRGHKGAILVDSKVDRGTTIRVLFPVSERVYTAAADTGEMEKAPAAGSGVSVSSGMLLVVDDDEMVRNTCKTTVEHFGFRVLTAADGEEAVRVFREHADQITCVILDLTMPRMDGVAAFNELRRIKPEVKTILSSGYNEQEAIQRFGEKGIAGFIQKPYRIASLRATLERVLKSAG
jgi:PAS domain S-box-containing protein